MTQDAAIHTGHLAVPDVPVSWLDAEATALDSEPGSEPV
jgi:hypothetical protein